jgi:hypothetical protein
VFCMDLTTNGVFCLTALTNWFCITTMDSVHCAVRTGSLYKTDTFRLWRDNAEYNGDKLGHKILRGVNDFCFFTLKRTWNQYNSEGRRRQTETTQQHFTILIVSPVLIK